MRCGIYCVSDGGHSVVSQRGLGDGHVLMEARIVVALSDVVVLSMTVGPGKDNAWISPKVGTMVDSGAGF